MLGSGAILDFSFACLAIHLAAVCDAQPCETLGALVTIWVLATPSSAVGDAALSSSLGGFRASLVGASLAPSMGFTAAGFIDCQFVAPVLVQAPLASSMLDAVILAAPRGLSAAWRGAARAAAMGDAEPLGALGRLAAALFHTTLATAMSYAES